MEQYEKIQECYPKQRKLAKTSNLEVLNAVLYIVENGCKWRRLSQEYGDWPVIDVRVNRWADEGWMEHQASYGRRIWSGYCFSFFCLACTYH